MENKELNEALERVIASLTEEQKEKAKACETLDQLTALLGELGVELPDELLDDVGGGFDLGSYFKRPIFRPLFGGLFGSSSGDEGVGAAHADLKDGSPVGAAHMDLKGKPSFTAVHTDVSAGTKGQGKSRYV